MSMALCGVSRFALRRHHRCMFVVVVVVGAAAAVVGFSCSAGRTHQSHHYLSSLNIFMGKIAAQDDTIALECQVE